MKTRQLKEKGIYGIFFIAGISSVLILAGIFLMLIFNGAKAFQDISLTEFFFSANWNPSGYNEASYGILAMVASTFMVTLGAMVIAVPLGVGTAAFLTDVAGSRIREFLKPVVEILASIPSVAIGFIGIVVVGPAIGRIFGVDNGLNALNGSVLLAVMALPTIISVAEDSIRAVPNRYREASYALGANRWFTLVKVVIPSSYPGIIAAIILGMGRAIGETMTVLMACGNAPAMPSGFFDSVRPITATIAIELGEVPFGTTHYYSLFAIGAVLFVLSFAVNMIAEAVAARFRRFHN